MTGAELLRDCPAAEDELPPMIALQFQEYPMSDPDANTRTTVYVKDTQSLAEALDLPLDMDPSKIVRIAREELTKRGLAKPLTLEEWVKMGAKFYNAERA